MGRSLVPPLVILLFPLSPPSAARDRKWTKDLLLGPDLHKFLVLFSPLSPSATPKAPKTTACQVVTAGFKQQGSQARRLAIFEVPLSDRLCV